MFYSSIHKVTVTSTTLSNSRPSVLKSAIISSKPKHYSTRSQPYPPTTTINCINNNNNNNSNISSNLSKINLINKYELRPRKTLISPSRYDPSSPINTISTHSPSSINITKSSSILPRYSPTSRTPTKR
uniref:Uncharacterized protein n=1 Tax=Panagrolaimus superbus TaxID=310955 RepID=A0A914XWZ5_9BILA